MVSVNVRDQDKIRRGQAGEWLRPAIWIHVDSHVVPCQYKRPVKDRLNGQVSGIGLNLVGSRALRMQYNCHQAEGKNAEGCLHMRGINLTLDNLLNEAGN